MKLGIINSAFAQAGVDTATGLSHIARIGFDTVDLFAEAMTITPDEKRLIARTCQKEKLPIISCVVVATG
ncbi:MAG: sugar phosphate isomerase/epimerase family protein, partial [Candidatus Acidiferrum sp.]